MGEKEGGGTPLDLGASSSIASTDMEVGERGGGKKEVH